MDSIAIEGIHLTKDDGKTIVEVQIEGLWYPVIEAKNGTQFDHFVSSGEMVDIVHKINLDLVKDDKPIVVQDIDYGAEVRCMARKGSLGRDV